jgi:uncharacterized protein YjbI with pentapeptide repeats
MGVLCEFFDTQSHWFLNEHVNRGFAQFAGDMADFGYAQCQEASFWDAQCQEAIFCGAQCQEASFSSAQCQGANFELAQ